MAADPYKVLGVTPNSSDTDITYAYRKLAKKYHPDLNQGNKRASEKMLEINSAYETIKAQKATQAEPLTAVDRARKLVASGDYIAAIEELNQCSARGAEWNCMMAICCYGVGDYSAAAKYAQNAISLQPENPEYRRVLRQIEVSSQELKNSSEKDLPLFSCSTLFIAAAVIGVILMLLFSRLCSGIRWW